MKRFHPGRGALALPLLAIAGCSSPPAQLYLLSSAAPAPQDHPAATAGFVGQGSSRMPAGTRAAGSVVGVTVTVPGYLDRLDIVQRTTANEIKPDYSAQWGESLSTTASHAVADNLTSLLPSDDVVILPSRVRRSYDYQVTLDLARFESDQGGRSVLAGRWSIADRDGNERAGGRVLHEEQAEPGSYDRMAAAMSRNLAAASADIAAALQKLALSAATAAHSGSSVAAGKR